MLGFVLLEVSPPGPATSEGKAVGLHFIQSLLASFLRLLGAVLANHAVTLGAVKLGATHSLKDSFLRHNFDEVVRLELLVSLVGMRFCRRGSYVPSLRLALHAKMSKLAPCPALVLVVDVVLYSSAFILARKTRESSITKWALPLRIGLVKVVVHHRRDRWGFGESLLAERRVAGFSGSACCSRRCRTCPRR